MIPDQISSKTIGVLPCRARRNNRGGPTMCTRVSVVVFIRWTLSNTHQEAPCKFPPHLQEKQAEQKSSPSLHSAPYWPQTSTYTLALLSKVEFSSPQLSLFVQKRFLQTKKAPTKLALITTLPFLSLPPPFAHCCCLFLDKLSMRKIDNGSLSCSYLYVWASHFYKRDGLEACWFSEILSAVRMNSRRRIVCRCYISFPPQSLKKVLS